MKILVFLALLGGCALLNSDVLTKLEQNGQSLNCVVNEPFINYHFNFYGDGRVKMTFPDPGTSGQIITQDVTRVGQSANAGAATFTLSNGAAGSITPTPGGACNDGMSDRTYDYRINFTNYGTLNGTIISDAALHGGCCSLVE